MDTHLRLIKLIDELKAGPCELKNDQNQTRKVKVILSTVANEGNGLPRLLASVCGLIWEPTLFIIMFAQRDKNVIMDSSTFLLEK